MLLTEQNMKELEQVAAQAREVIINTVYKVGAGHLGGPLSATDILTALYNHVLNIDPKNPDWEQRDRFVLSKGHSAIALYTVLALRGYFPVEEMETFDGMQSRLQAHPDKDLLPGLDMSTGSLGQGISTAVGMALGAKLKGDSFMTYCMIGDGESQEGQMWEAADVAAKYNLDNLIVIMDYNKLQQYGWAGEEEARLNPIQNPEVKWKAFKWDVITIDGHSMKEIIAACQKAKKTVGKPTIIIANTVKGKGVHFMENNYLWHSKVPTKEEYAVSIKEISKGGLNHDS
ncbi:transketolase [Oceanobacillus jeddahense]|uniref:Transketolase n=1 Tax=Oceanobacillus jeddahense TaxID=1462527 RepID=A0ABY5JSW4_9BACI|nr:transketolase [Oceanobacillus jeddahense]UUI02875.1 transketolase [Oceanobacillus jeddahense]